MVSLGGNYMDGEGKRLPCRGYEQGSAKKTLCRHIISNKEK